MEGVGVGDCGECAFCKYKKGLEDFSAYKDALAKRLCEEAKGKEMLEVQKNCEERMLELKVEEAKVIVLREAAIIANRQRIEEHMGKLGKIPEQE